jgi:ribose 5-phosphate isomerase A
MTDMTAPGEAMARRAVDLVADGSVIGLGTGRAASAFARALAEQVRAGLRVRCVPTSRATERIAEGLAIPVVSLDEAGELDLDVDGADEVDPRLDLVKGYGGALVREKIVAAASKRLVILAEPAKLVPILGTRGRLPVEVVAFGWARCARALEDLGCRPGRRLVGEIPFVTDNGNYILDCGVEPIADPAGLQRRMRSIPGVVDTGLFLEMADTLFLEDEHGAVAVRHRTG